MNSGDLSKYPVLQKSTQAGITPSDPSNRSIVRQNSATAQSSSGVRCRPAVVEDSLVGNSVVWSSLESQIEALEKSAMPEDGGCYTAEAINDPPAAQTTRPSDVPAVSQRVIGSLAEFEALGSRWQNFKADPMSGFDWNYAWWQSFQENGDLHLITFEQDGEVVGLAPFFVDRWFGLNRFRFLATGSVCSDYVDLVCDPKHYELCAASLAQYVKAKNFDVVELDCTKENRLAQQLTPPLKDKYQIDQRTAEPTWRLDLPGTWKEFVASTKSSLRRKINKAVRRIDSDEFEISSTAEGLDFDSAIEVLESLHTRRFNSMDKPGVFVDDRFTEFLQGAARELCCQGKCEIVVAAENGEPFAAQIYFEGEEGFQFYQGGCDPDAMKLEPGHFMFTFMVRRAIERGDHVFDFLRGDEPYKAFWGASPHSQWKVRMVSNRVLPTLVFKTIATGRRLLRRS